MNWVLDDVIESFVSIERARELHGAAIRRSDEDATETVVTADETAHMGWRRSTVGARRVRRLVP